MKIRHRHYLSEEVADWIDSSTTKTMTDEEQWWHKRITSILLNKKGKWGAYQHALYALRFQDFILKIVPIHVDKTFTACVVFDKAVIYVGEGFLIDDSKCYQLNVIIRHELAHILLRHQIRMVHKIGELPYSKIAMSNSIQKLINIIADFEISNKKYTSEDKSIVLNMYLNGKLISGLVTEMHRETWATLPIEEMYDKLTEELDQISSDFADAEGDISSLSYYSDTGKKLRKKDDITYHGVQAVNMYANRTEPSTIWLPVEEYIKTSKQFAACAESVQKLIISLFKALKSFNEPQLTYLLETVSKSKVFETVVLNRVMNVEVTAPEEKFWANQVLKSLLGNARPKPKTTIKKVTHSKEYIDSYNTIIRKCGRIADCSDEELASILGSINFEES